MCVSFYLFFCLSVYIDIPPCVHLPASLKVRFDNVRFFFALRVIDLGVMTPCEKILKTAIEEGAGEKLNS